MDEIQKEIKKEMQNEEVKAWLFADDIVIIGEKEEEVQGQLDVRNKHIENWGMKISKKKSKTLVMTRKSREGRGEIRLKGEILEVVESFKYLGSEISQDGCIGREIDRRIQEAGNLYQSVRGLIWNKEIPRRCKEVIYKTYYIPILTYASET